MKYNGSTIISYEQILLLINNGITGYVKNGKKGKFSFAHEGGLYLGAPGKEIYFSLSTINKIEMNDVAYRLATLFPIKPPNNHVKWAACIRYIQGCFEKQGCLRSEEDKKRMINERSDWTISFDFMSMLKENFDKSNISYGLVLWYEMMAHRYGDMAIIYAEERNENIEKMERYYLLSQSLGMKIKSWKHTFTPFYWAGHYFYEIGMKDMCLKYHKKSLEMMNKYCPDARDGYREKAAKSLEHIKKTLNTKEWDKWYKIFKKNVNNKCLLKVIKKIHL